jgi:O-antigen/teichoic acid export membrane protein
MALRDRLSLRRLFFLVASTLIGAFIGMMCIGDIILSWLYGYDHGFGEGNRSIAIGIIAGAIGGAITGLLSGEWKFRK